MGGSCRVGCGDNHGDNDSAREDETNKTSHENTDHRTNTGRNVMGESGQIQKTTLTVAMIPRLRTEKRTPETLINARANRVTMATEAVPTFALDELTAREMTVSQMLGRGYSVEKIQDRSDLSQKTVEAYRRRAKDKLGFDAITELLQYVVQWTYGQAPEQATGHHGAFPRRSSRGRGAQNEN